MKKITSLALALALALTLTACGKQEQHGGQCACPDRQSAEAQNRADALLRTAFCKAAAKGRGLRLPLRHVKKLSLIHI